MTYRPRAIYDLRMVEFIRDFKATHGCAPSVRDIGRALGISSTIEFPLCHSARVNDQEDGSVGGVAIRCLSRI
jgi:LexA DNA binding domain